MKTLGKSTSVDSTTVGYILRSAEIFRDWPPDAMAQLLEIAQLGRCPKGQHLRPEDPLVREVLIIGSGYLAVSTTTHQGRDFLLGIFGPAHILGILRLLPGSVAAYDYMAREDAVVARLPSDPFLALLNKRPALWADVANMALRQYHSAFVEMINRRIGTISGRVAMLLENLLNLHGVEGPEGFRLRVRISQEDLAAMLSVTRQTINKELQALEALQIIRIDYSDLLIRDRPALLGRFDHLD